MRIDWSKALSEGLRFGFHPKRWLQLLVVDAVFVSVIISSIYLNLSDIVYIISSMRTGADRFLVMSLLNYILIPVFVFIVWFLVRIWMQGSIIYQGWKTKDSEIGKSWRFACRKYPSLFLAILIITLVSMLVSVIPYMGWVLAIVVSWIFYFALQAVIIRNVGFYEGLEDSYKIFRKNPFEVIIIWLIVLIVNIVIFGIFALPFAYLLLTNLFYLAQNTGIASIILMFREQVILFATSGLILLMGISIATTFTLKAQVEFYLQLRKRFRIL
ncbi:MAG: hypothetical protein GTN38_00020 [Candidatus Aenigmarchaeota archaeon]|nr:hypothetical protein [Candidatus Aenigmarchaeota archaeon]NIP39890.1 hypothetical protein [Candidatus Aenigmarchaeota archaeon]NIQ17609.1 hypothetical protein [Candidatus Aenigmarchaeota archaeon]NIS72797.1 hypothetical protein [Candidatus Aenigmarchaeota archaeon]